MRTIENEVNYFALQGELFVALKNAAKDYIKKMKKVSIIKLKRMLRTDIKTVKSVLEQLERETYIKCTGRFRKTYILIEKTFQPTTQESKNPTYDSVLAEVKEYIKTSDTISASRVQARWSIGYPTAHKIMETLLKEGLVKSTKEGTYTVLRESGVTEPQKHQAEQPKLEQSTIDEKLIKKIKTYLKTADYISVSRIQAKFSIGYPKALKIMNLLIEEGLVKKDNNGYTIIR
ncbi:MAG: hypothetical protein E7354_03270 [Clostridiales bacterium]|nr:hypothetical protein [Clostridiales bacterium]